MSSRPHVIAEGPKLAVLGTDRIVSIPERLGECAAALHQHVREASRESIWLRDNHAFLQAQIVDLRHTLRPSYLRKLHKTKHGLFARDPRIRQIAAGLVEEAQGVIDSDVLMPFADYLRQKYALDMIELWAFAPMLKLAIIERLCQGLDSELAVSNGLRSLWALEAVSWSEFVEAASRVEDVLRQDPAQIYARMDFATRDRYRLELRKLAQQARVPEEDIAEAALQCAERARDDAKKDTRTIHIGYYLLGPGARELRRAVQRKTSLLHLATDFANRHPSFSFGASALLVTGLLLAGFAWVTGAFPWWMALLLSVPASQAALELMNAAVSRLLDPRSIPCMDFTEGIPDDCQTMVAVPTLLLSEAGVEKLLKDLEVRYLANRDRNLFFALLTDFADADRLETERDGVLKSCIQGIRLLNGRYGAGGRQPFYLFHRGRVWNSKERRWMGHERKRGKLNDLNRLLQGRGNRFDTVIGDRSRLLRIRYVITLDTDTQLPRDAAAKMVAAMAHPLNRPVLDPVTRTVTEGYALLRPRVAISMESAQRSWIARIFSGQPGFDPYAANVSDLYHDLHGQASFTGKGIYDVDIFDAAVGERFPDNAILSHDLIEGEHARTGLLTSVEVVEDYPATYSAYSKRKHRWVRGDWQLVPWLFGHPPVPGGRAKANPLSALSRWKIADNLRRSLFEIAVFLALVCGWLMGQHPLRWTLAMLLLLQLPAYADMLLSAVRAPERRFWRSFAHMLGKRFLQTHRDTLLTVIFLPHQACLMADAIIRTLWRRYISGSNLLEWETMAQSELAMGARLSAFQLYLYASAVIWLPVLLLFGPIPLVVAITCELWITAPLIAAWLGEPLPRAAGISADDRDFLRDTALRTWRYFRDHSDAEHHWLVPDNVQDDPPLTAHNISPTNLGLLLTSHLAAHDFGYLNLDEVTGGIQRILASMKLMPRHRGHFFNWYETCTLTPLTPRYVSSVDSGNLAASLSALRQGCLLRLEEPMIGDSVLEGIRDHVLRLRDELPYESRTFSMVRLFDSLLHQLQCRPKDLFFYEAVLTESSHIVQRLEAAMVPVCERLDAHQACAKADELRYWARLLSERINSALAELWQLAPWLSPAFEPELRVNLRDASLASVIAALSQVPKLGQALESYQRIRTRVTERLYSPRPLYPALRTVLKNLLEKLPDARAAVLDLTDRLEESAEICQRYFQEMDFGFFYDEDRQLLRIGYNVDADRPDQSCYDLLASEARTAVFLAIAKGDIPRETWMRLGRKLTAYRDQVSLLAWSGTMFEYLMPLIHLRSYAGTLLDRAVRAAVRIQEAYGKERGVPWGISEAAHAERDGRMQYQYRAFGVPPLSASGEAGDHLVVAPYASMLALMLDPAAATANLRSMAASGWRARHGFFESIDYSRSGTHGSPDVVRCFMAHHQGMALLAIDNALLDNRMQERFHHDPIVQAIEFLLEERMPALVDFTPASEAAYAWT
jgi:cyclic beta-1,2-glucan glucanotransferase